MNRVDIEKTGKRIAFLRKERGYTGEALAERLQVSPQAISKWENARCLPETSVLPALAEALGCSIDSLLCPGEILILEAVYTDGQTAVPVTGFINGLVRNQDINIPVNGAFLGVSIPGQRLKVLTIKYQTPEGIFYSYALQNSSLVLNRGNDRKQKSACYEDGQSFQIVGAWYGNEKAFSSAMEKMAHYAYFNWDKIPVNQEAFPSDTASDDTEYLTLVYLNKEGIHVISCPENEAIYYRNHRTSLFLEDRTKCILKGITRLSWGEGMDCPWAGSMYAALQYMGENYAYHQIMGMSGACWRLCFTEVWDYSCTDALVAFDYASPLFQSLGYSFRMADRVEKQERKAERLAIMEDIRQGKPVLAINLRVAPEWGVITGYTEEGGRFLCRTYFDREIFRELEQADSAADKEDRRIVFEENEGYLFSDFWPFLLLHFGQKEDAPSPLETLKASLGTLISSFRAEASRGYAQGKGAYEAWIRGLAKDADFRLDSDRENVLRRLCVNDSMLVSLIDARQSAACYLEEAAALLPECSRRHLEKIGANCRDIAGMFADFRDKTGGTAEVCSLTYNTDSEFRIVVSKLEDVRREQAALLQQAVLLEEENCRLAQLILDGPWEACVL